MDITMLTNELAALHRTINNHREEALEKIHEAEKSNRLGDAEYWQGIKNEAVFLLHLLHSFPEAMGLIEDFCTEED
jgi:hypothetical protein